MKYFIILFFFVSCSNKNYQQNVVNNNEVIFHLNEVVIVDKKIISEIKTSILQYVRDCKIKPDYGYLIKEDKMILSLTKYQISDDFKINEIQNRLNLTKGILFIDEIPILIYYKGNDDKSFYLKKNKLKFDIKSSNQGCVLDKYYQFKNEELILYDEFFLGNIKVEKAK
jgi:hypothetical protein